MSLSFGDQAQARSTFKTDLMSQSWNPNHCVSMFSFFFLKFYENLCFGSLPWILWHAMYFEFYLSIIGRKLKRQVSPTVVQNMKLSKPMPQKSLKTCWLSITSSCWGCDSWVGRASWKSWLEKVQLHWHGFDSRSPHSSEKISFLPYVGRTHQ